MTARDTAATYKMLRRRARQVAERHGYLSDAGFDRDLAEAAEVAMQGKPNSIPQACGMLRDMIEWYSN